jgi:tripartite-type tricarboxylate transporter receptor subunit TctC
MKTIRTLIGAALAFTLSCMAALPDARADDFPSRPIHMVVGFSAGSISDVTVRLIAEQAQKTLNQPIVIENIAGAGSTLAAARVAKSPPDGYTLLFTALGHAIAPAIYSNLPYDAVKDFAGVATVADARVLLVTQPQYGFKSAVEFIADAKAHPGKYTFGSSGNGTFLHLIGESLAESAGIQLMHVPYRSGAEAVTAVMGGTIDLAFCTVNTCAAQVDSGKLIALGYIAKSRHPMEPKVPTFGELGIDFDVGGYNYILAPAKTPDAVLQKLHAAFNAAVTSAETKERFQKMGLDPLPSPNPQAVTDFVKSEVARWTPVVRRLGLKAN